MRQVAAHSLLAIFIRRQLLVEPTLVQHRAVVG
jgi:hypothetical protein